MAFEWKLVALFSAIFNASHDASTMATSNQQQALTLLLYYNKHPESISIIDTRYHNAILISHSNKEKQDDWLHYKKSVQCKWLFLNTFHFHHSFPTSLFTCQSNFISNTICVLVFLLFFTMATIWCYFRSVPTAPGSQSDPLCSQLAL